MTRAEAVAFIANRHGKIFSVRFRKRSGDRAVREMSCRQGVKTGLADFPSKPATDWQANGLIPVWSMKDNAYRSIPIEGILGIKIGGEWEEVT